MDGHDYPGPGRSHAAHDPEAPEASRQPREPHAASRGPVRRPARSAARARPLDRTGAHDRRRTGTVHRRPPRAGVVRLPGDEPDPQPPAGAAGPRPPAQPPWPVLRPAPARADEPPAAGGDDPPRRVDVHRPLRLCAPWRPVADRVRLVPGPRRLPGHPPRRDAGEPAGEGRHLRPQPAVRLDAVAVADGPGAGLGARPRRRRLAGHPQRRGPDDLPARRPARGAGPAGHPGGAVRPAVHRQPGPAQPVQGLGDRLGGRRAGRGGRRRTGRCCASPSATRVRRDASRTASSGSSRTGRTSPRSRRSTRRPTSTSTPRRPRTSRPRSSRRWRPACRWWRPRSAGSPSRSAASTARQARGAGRRRPG